MKSNFYIKSIEPLVANHFYDLVQLDFFCTLYQVEKDTRCNVCFFECGCPIFIYFSMADMGEIDVVTSVFSMRSDRLQSEISTGLELLTVNVEDGRVNQKVHKNKLVQVRDSIQDKLTKFSTVVSMFGDSLKAIPPDRRDEFNDTC